jgi:hypothetical protein
MATITPVSSQSKDVSLTTWTGVSTADTATAIGPMNRGVGAKRASVTFTGTFGGATVVLQGSNDGTNWGTLTDLAGNEISVTAAAVREFSSSCLYIRPSSSGGAGDNVDVVLAQRT